MSQDFFVSSVVPWFRNSADDVIRNILEATFSQDTGISTDLFRPAIGVPDATSGNIVPVAAERLIRWDNRHPNDVFWFGFQPRSSPAQGQFPHTEFDLTTYVSNNVQSIFVGTARYYRNQNNVLTRWRSREHFRFEYEIFAFGGIDVNYILNNVLGENHRYANQHEIAFPGGIAREFIRSAREYDDQNRLVRIWDNPRFDSMANGPNHSPALETLPPPIRGIPVPVMFFTERDGAVDPDNGQQPGAPPHHHDELRRRRSAEEEQAVDPMRTDGDAVPDETLNVSPVPRPSCACVHHPSDSGRAYFFYVNHYAAIDVNPGTTGDTIAWGPKLLLGNWPSLVQAGFGNVDAVLPNPNNSQEMYFFCMEKYALIDIKPGTTSDYIVNGPKVIINEWPSLRQAGFKTIDAVLPNPANSHEAYFFSNESYALINIKPGTNDDYIVNGPKPIWDSWPSLKQAGFKVVDAILPNPSNSNEAYFFSGDQYALINIKPGSTDDYIVNGPKLVRTEWPSLHQAGFW